MTDEQTTDSAAEEPTAQADAAEAAEAAPASAKAREWLSQLEAMIQDVATQAAPIARQVGAKAAELAAVAAVKAGPVAHKAADLTTDYGQRFAEKAHAVAADLRHPSAAEGEVSATEAPAPEGEEPPRVSS